VGSNQWRIARIPFIAVLLGLAWAVTACSPSVELDSAAVPTATKEPSVNEPMPTAFPTSTPTPQPTPTPSPTNTPAPQPTSTPSPTNTPTPQPTSTPSPTNTPTPQPTPTPLLYVYDANGFTVALDSGSSFASVNLATAGWTGADADLDQGLLTFTYKGASIVLFWLPTEQQTPSTILSSTYQLLRGSQPNVTFQTVNEGDLGVSGETGMFGGFVATDSTGASAGGGLIGTWVCSRPNTAFSLTGSDATSLQIRFDRLVSGFLCR
jgi:hypothetical protein